MEPVNFEISLEECKKIQKGKLVRFKWKIQGIYRKEKAILCTKLYGI